MTVTLISLKLLFNNNQVINRQQVILKGDKRSTKRYSDEEGYVNFAGGKWKAGQTLTITVNGYTAYTQLNTGINKLQVMMPTPSQNSGSLTLKLVDRSTRKPAAGVNVSVVVLGKQFAQTFKTDTQGKFTINASSQNGISLRDQIQVTVTDQRYQNEMRTFQIIYGARTVTVPIRSRNPAPQFTLNLRLNFPGQCDNSHVMIKALNKSKSQLNNTKNTMHAYVKNCVGKVQQPQADGLLKFGDSYAYVVRTPQYKRVKGQFVYQYDNQEVQINMVKNR